MRLRPFGDIPRRFPPHRNQSRRPAYWCLMRVVVLFCVHTGAALGCAAGALSASEQVLAAGFIMDNPGRFLYIGDRNFGIFRIAQAARAAGAEVLLRLTHQRARRLLGRSLQPGVFDLNWSPPPATTSNKRAAPAPRCGDVCWSYRSGARGFAPKPFACSPAWTPVIRRGN